MASAESPLGLGIGVLAGNMAATLALAEQIPVEQADRIVGYVLETLGYKYEITESPYRRALLAPFRLPPVH